jgi:hypothetical protein
VAKLVIQRTTLSSSSQTQKNDHSWSRAILARGGQARGHRVGVARVAQPQIVGQERIELGGDEAHLGRELSRLLASEACTRRQLGAQEDDRLAVEEPVLGAAEGEHVDAGAGGHLGQ